MIRLRSSSPHQPGDVVPILGGLVRVVKGPYRYADGVFEFQAEPWPPPPPKPQAPAPAVVAAPPPAGPRVVWARLLELLSTPLW